jgi:hypothetical protein
MGDIADYYMDLAMEQDARMEADRHFEREAVENMEKSYMMGSLKWPTQFDGEILLSKMSGNHLINTVDFLKNKEQTEVRKTWIKLMTIEIEKR